MLKKGIINVALRGLTAGSKFVLALFMARYLLPDDMGIYGLISACIAIGIYLLGFDFYTFNSREILSADKHKQPVLIRDQLVFHVLMYVFTLPLLALVFIFGVLPIKYIVWVYVLLMLQHLSTEINRLLITLSYPVLSNLICFLSSSIWIYPTLALIVYTKDIRIVLIGWIIGCSISLIASSYIWRSFNWKIVLHEPINWNWILFGFKKSLPFFCSTIALVFLTYSDRFFLNYFYGSAIVGVYTFYTTIASSVQIFVYHGVIAIIHPKLIKSYQNKDFDNFKKMIIKLSSGIIVSSIILVIIAFVGMEFMLNYYIKVDLYYKAIAAFWLYLIAVLITNIGQVPHYILYVQHKDKAILLSTLSAFIIAIIMNLLLIPSHGIIGASISYLCAMITIAIMKIVMIKITSKKGANK